MSYLVELKSFLFSTRRKRVDLYLFILLIVALWAGRSPFNAWLVETVGERMSTVSAFLGEYPWLLFCLCVLICLGTGLYILNHIQDHYRSRRSMMVILLLANIFIASAGYWDYVLVVGRLSLLHLLLICLLLAFISVCIVFQRKSKSAQELTGRHFTIDAVDSAAGEDLDKNRLGYADYLVDRILGTEFGDESFSVGISGEWGTGKTTFLNAVASSLEKYFPERVATIVWFRPWDSSSPKQIVTDFFNVLVDKIGPQYSVVRKPMLKYTELLKALDTKKPIVYLADVYDKHNEHSINSLKSVISTYLKSYGKIIPVLIDDMDRLSGEEIAEVLRLIRNTADFPNVVYVTAYDKGYVEAQLQKKGIPNPGIYIEKFFSVEFALPKLEDYYQYNVFAQEVHKMCSEPAIVNYADRMPGKTQQFLCSAFHNFRQVKRFARIFVHDAEFFNTKFGLVQHLSLDDFLLLKILHYTDSALYTMLELQQYDLMVRGKDIWKGFYPLKLRPQVFDSNEKETPLIPSFKGNPITGLSKEILEYLFSLNDGKNARNLVNHETYPLYFALDINGRHVSVLDVWKLITGDGDLAATFQKWDEENNLNSVYYHLLSFRPGAMDEHAVKRYLSLVIKLIPSLMNPLAIIDRSLFVVNHPTADVEELQRFVVSEFETMIDNVSTDDMMNSAHTSIAHALVYIYELEMNEEHENGAEGKTLVGSMATAKHLLEKNFAQFVSVTVPDTDELFRDNSYFQELVKSNVLVVDTEDGPFIGSNLIADAILAYCTAHKGHKKQEAALKYSLPPDTPVQYEDDIMENLLEKKESVFGHGDLYKKLLESAFTE